MEEMQLSCWRACVAKGIGFSKGEARLATCQCNGDEAACSPDAEFRQQGGQCGGY
jgi:hypothetical protein